MTFEEELVGLRPHLFRQAMKFARTIDGAEDLLQDTMTKALANKDKFHPGTNLAAWAFTILRNHFYQQVRRESRFVEDPDDSLSRTLSIEAPQHPREDFRDTWSAFLSLPIAMQNALYLVGLLGHEYDDAAGILGVPTGTIKSRVSRARAKLEKNLA